MILRITAGNNHIYFDADLRRLVPEPLNTYPTYLEAANGIVVEEMMSKTYHIECMAKDFSIYGQYLQWEQSRIYKTTGFTSYATAYDRLLDLAGMNKQLMFRVVED